MEPPVATVAKRMLSRRLNFFSFILKKPPVTRNRGGYNFPELYGSNLLECCAAKFGVATSGSTQTA